MAFATRSDLLARSNVRRLAQLAVPADVDMPPEDALRTAIAGGDLSALSAADRDAIDLALVSIDKALADADALLISYGVPQAVQTSLLARLASTVALYYLQGAERMTDEVQRAYDGVERTLRAYARGELVLVPQVPSTTDVTDVAYIEAGSRRYGNYTGGALDDGSGVGL